MCYDSPASHTVHVNLRVSSHVSSLKYTCGKALYTDSPFDLFNSKPVRPISPKDSVKNEISISFDLLLILSKDRKAMFFKITL